MHRAQVERWLTAALPTPEPALTTAPSGSKWSARRSLCGAPRVARSEIGPTHALISGRSSSPQLAELAPHEREQPVLSDGAQAAVEATASCWP
jgi:hypothetical protein